MNSDKGSQDPKGCKIFLKAAKGGDADAQKRLGIFYFVGKGVNKDSEEVLKWFLKSALQGNLDPQNFLGYQYYNGIESLKIDLMQRSGFESCGTRVYRSSISSWELLQPKRGATGPRKSLCGLC